jgi:hypothetical protein
VDDQGGSRRRARQKVTAKLANGKSALVISKFSNRPWSMIMPPASEAERGEPPEELTFSGGW